MVLLVPFVVRRVVLLVPFVVFFVLFVVPLVLVELWDVSSSTLVSWGRHNCGASTAPLRPLRVAVRLVPVPVWLVPVPVRRVPVPVWRVPVPVWRVPVPVRRVPVPVLRVVPVVPVVPVLVVLRVVSSTVREEFQFLKQSPLGWEDDMGWLTHHRAPVAAGVCK